MKTINALFLYGCNQNVVMAKSLTKDLVKIFMNDCKKQNVVFNMFYLEAQYNQTSDDNEKKTWLSVPLNLDELKSNQLEYSKYFPMINDTMAYIDEFIKMNNINLLIGFSQGGNMIDNYLTYYQKRNNESERNISFAIIFSGYQMLNSERTINDNVKVINVFSNEDDIVPCMIRPTFKTSFDIEHNRGHKIPNNPIIRTISTKLCEISDNYNEIQ